MSNFYKVTKHPITGKWEKATWLDNYFGGHHYGVKFSDGQVLDERAYDFETRTEEDLDAPSF